MFEQYGSMVRVNERRMIPAVNIQVEGVPGFLDDGRDDPHWYGVYFEIMWEDASLWVFQMGDKQEQPAIMTLREYRNWGTGIGRPIEGPQVVLTDADELISRYDEKRHRFNFSF